MSLSLLLKRSSTKLLVCPNSSLSANLLRFASASFSVSSRNNGLFSNSEPKSLIPQKSFQNVNYLKPISPLNIARQFSVSPVHKSAHGNHATVWKLERIMSAGLLALVPAAIAYPHPVLDNTVAVFIALHTYWGFEAIVNDYVRPIIFGNVVPAVTHALLAIVTALSLGGLLYFNYNDVGIGEAIRKLWSIPTEQGKKK